MVMDTSLILNILFLIYFFIKTILFLINSEKAIEYIYTQPNWDHLKTEYIKISNIIINIAHPFRWTYRQMYRGLGRV